MATLIDLSILFLAIILVGGFILMSEKGIFRAIFKGLPQRRYRKVARKKTPAEETAASPTTMEMAEELPPPSPPRQEPCSITGREAEGEIPARYGETGITALARDPYWLFTYWEVAEETKAEVRRRFGPTAWEASQPVLRVYDLSGVYFFDSRRVLEIAINDYADNWYVNTGEPGHTYCVELGRLLPDGTYIFIARSNLVSMPRDGISEIVDYEWLFPFEYERLFYERGGVPSSPEFIRRVFAVQGHLRGEEYVSSPLQWPREQGGSPLKW